MAAPDFVPTAPLGRRSYTSPVRRPGSWMPDRPGELAGRQPEGERLGSPGPDQGYVLHLVDAVVESLKLGSGEHAADAAAAVSAVALKRAASFGRAPVSHDVTAAVSALGFDVTPPTGEAAECRRLALEEAHHPHFYKKLRAIADAVPTELLHQPIAAITTADAVTWY